MSTIWSEADGCASGFYGGVAERWQMGGERGALSAAAASISQVICETSGFVWCACVCTCVCVYVCVSVCECLYVLYLCLYVCVSLCVSVFGQTIWLRQIWALKLYSIYIYNTYIYIISNSAPITCQRPCHAHHLPPPPLSSFTFQVG